MFFFGQRYNSAVHFDQETNDSRFTNLNLYHMDTDMFLLNSLFISKLVFVTSLKNVFFISLTLLTFHKN